MSSLHPAVAFADDADGSAVDLGDDGSVDLGLAHAEGKRSEDEEASLFDTIVGVLQSALLRIRPEVESFCLAHCDVFEAAAENKLQYMDVYTRYSRMIEEHLERSLAAALPGTSLSEVERLLASRPDEVPDDVFDVLISDFDEFKDLMLSYREQKEADAGAGAGHVSGYDEESRHAGAGASSASSAAAAAAGGARSAGLPPLAAAGRSSLSLAGLSISGSSLSPHKSGATAGGGAAFGGAGSRSGGGPHKGLAAGSAASAGGYGYGALPLPPPSPILAEPAGFFASSR